MRLWASDRAPGRGEGARSRLARSTPREAPSRARLHNEAVALEQRRVGLFEEGLRRFGRETVAEARADARRRRGWAVLAPDSEGAIAGGVAPERAEEAIVLVEEEEVPVVSGELGDEVEVSGGASVEDEAEDPVVVVEREGEESGADEVLAQEHDEGGGRSVIGAWRRGGCRRLSLRGGGVRVSGRRGSRAGSPARRGRPARGRRQRALAVTTAATRRRRETWGRGALLDVRARAR